MKKIVTETEHGTEGMGMWHVGGARSEHRAEVGAGVERVTVTLFYIMRIYGRMETFVCTIGLAITGANAEGRSNIPPPRNLKFPKLFI